MTKKATIAVIPKDKQGIQILFFGRDECEGSERLLNQILRDGFDVTYVKSSHARGEKLPKEIHEWVGDYIICFRTLFILPDSLLKKAKVAAINFHPGPPEYPGSGCINFALYDQVSDFGVTAHLMTKKVDNGKILEVRRFPIEKSENLSSVLERTHAELHSLCSDFIAALSAEGESFIALKALECADIHWVGQARFIRELDKLQIIHEGITQEELERIIRATYIDGFPPKIRVHGYKFSLSLEDQISEQESKKMFSDPEHLTNLPTKNKQMKKILIFGTGGHSKVIVDIILHEGEYEIAGFIDNALNVNKTVLGYKVLGQDEDLANLITDNSIIGGVIAIGDNYSREKITRNIYKFYKNFTFINCIHPSAQIASDVSMGVGNVIMAGSVVNSSTSIGSHCILNTNSSVDHDNVMLDFSSIAPNAATGGNVQIGERSTLGIGSTVLEGISIGPDSLVGGGSLVLADVKPKSIYFGNPAKFIRKNLIN